MLLSNSTCVSISWSPDGTKIASASSDTTVIVWNPNTGSELARLEGHDASVFACAWSPDGAQLAGPESRVFYSQ
jgi:WD40 repeat protein